MSAPRTNIEKQKRQHIVPIIGMIVILILVGIGFVWWLADETNDPMMPGEETGPVDEMNQPAAPAAQAPAAQTPAAPGD